MFPEVAAGCVNRVSRSLTKQKTDAPAPRPPVMSNFSFWRDRRYGFIPPTEMVPVDDVAVFDASVVAVVVVDVVIGVVGRRVSVVSVSKFLKRIARHSRESNLSLLRAKRRLYHRCTPQR